jgi:phage FluMu gp28-like protein
LFWFLVSDFGFVNASMIEPLHYFLPYQLAWLKEPASLAVAQKSRRIGWTYMEAYRAVERRVQSKGNLYFSSADLTAAKEFIDYCEMWAKIFNVVAVPTIERTVIDESEITALVLTFADGRKIVAGSSNPKFFRSKGGDGDLDEFAFHSDGRQMFKAFQPTAMWGGQLRVWSTHNGEGSFFHGLVNAVQSGELKGALHTVTIVDAVEQGLVEKIKGLKARDDGARKEWLADQRATCRDEDSWNEEYMCRPSSEQSALLSYDLIRGCERTGDELRVVEDPRELRTNAPMYYGFDVGRQRDLSVFWGLAKVGDVFETRLVKRFLKTPYDVQEGFLNLCMGASNAKRLCGDQTGIGNMLLERAVQKWGRHRVEGLTFSAPVKAELALPLVRLFEDRLVRIPGEAATREGLHKVRKIVTAAGNVRFDAKHDEAGHADEFWALALAYHAADDLKLPLLASRRMKPVGW